MFTTAEFDACTPSTTVAAVRSFFASGLPSAGWAESATYPYDGQYQAQCGDPYCWSKGAAPRFVSLEKVTDRGSGLVSYHLRLAVPPTPPNCPSGEFGGRPYEAFIPHTDIPLPPLTSFGPGDGSGNYTNNAMCSAGTAASINAFFTTELPKLGFAVGSLPGSDDCGGPSVWHGWVKGNEGLSWNASSGASYSPGWSWSIGYCVA
jgi:hypothetical protein